MGSGEIGRLSLIFPLQELYVRLLSHTAQALSQRAARSRSSRRDWEIARSKLATFQRSY